MPRSAPCLENQMKPPRRGESHWDVYLWNDRDMPMSSPFRRVASCLSVEARDAILRLYEGNAFWAEVTKP